MIYTYVKYTWNVYSLYGVQCTVCIKAFECLLGDNDNMIWRVIWKYFNYDSAYDSEACEAMWRECRNAVDEYTASMGIGNVYILKWRICWNGNEFSMEWMSWQPQYLNVMYTYWNDVYVEMLLNSLWSGWVYSINVYTYR